MGWYNPNWKWRKKISFNSSANLTNMRVYINIMGDTHVGEYAQSGGQDILFTQSDGVTLIPFQQLDFQYQSWDWPPDIIPKVDAEWWLYLSTVSTPTTSVYMYYGNSDSTLTAAPNVSTNDWPENYCTFHFPPIQTPLAPIQEYVFPEEGEFLPGEVARAISSLDLSNAPGPSVIYHNGILEEFTMSSFISPSGAYGESGLFVGFNSGIADVGIGIDNSGYVKLFDTKDWPISVPGNYPLSATWHHAALTYNQTLNGQQDVLTLYIDGVLFQSTPGVGQEIKDCFNLLIANNVFSTLFVMWSQASSMACEARLSRGARTADEIQFEATNLLNSFALTFLTYSSPGVEYIPSGMLHFGGKAACISSHSQAKGSGSVYIQGQAKIKAGYSYKSSVGYLSLGGQAPAGRLFIGYPQGGFTFSGKALVSVNYFINLSSAWNIEGYVESSLATSWNIAQTVNGNWVKVPNTTTAYAGNLFTPRTTKTTGLIESSGSVYSGAANANTSTTSLDNSWHWEYTSSPKQLYWFRVQGACQENGGCNTNGFEPSDSNCNPPKGQGTGYIQLVAAANVDDLCQKLLGRFIAQPLPNWKIKSIKQYSQPIYSDTSSTNTCGVWQEINWKNAPSCLTFNLESGSGTGGVNSGTVTFSGDGKYLPVFVYPPNSTIPSGFVGFTSFDSDSYTPSSSSGGLILYGSANVSVTKFPNNSNYIYDVYGLHLSDLNSLTLNQFISLLVTNGLHLAGKALFKIPHVVYTPTSGQITFY